MNENTNATVTKRRGRPKKVETTPTTPVTETQKISDIVSRNVKAATKEKGSPLTREELTQACLTPKDMIDEHGVFMGEDYAKILKKPHSEEELKLIANKYQYGPVMAWLSVVLSCISKVRSGIAVSRCSAVRWGSVLYWYGYVFYCRVW